MFLEDDRFRRCEQTYSNLSQNYFVDDNATITIILTSVV